MKLLLGLIGVDIPLFTTHSNQSSSKANKLELSKKDIHRVAGWRGNNTFRISCNLPILKNLVTKLLVILASIKSNIYRNDDCHYCVHSVTVLVLEVLH